MEGKRYIDFAGGIAVLNTGHRHPRVIEAVKAQLDAYTHTAFQVLPYEPYVAVCERLAAMAPIETAKAILFSTGAEAVENAIKIARAATGRPGIICILRRLPRAHNDDHGADGKGCTLQDQVRHLAAGRLSCAVSRAEHGTSVADTLKALDYLFRADIGPENVAAFIIEPVQGEGGFHPSRPTRTLRSASRAL